MGIRGLTTFMKKYSYRCMKKHELHDTYLVIDGNNLACHLYLWHANCYDCFGGDYDKYAKLIEYFFDLLKQCNVTPLVILDGGYENKKLKTICSRVKSHIKHAGNLTSATEHQNTIFPLFTREVFVDVLLRLNVKMVRCDFEADVETASIAISLNCPVLSYDSDFYVLDVLYIPFSTLEFNLQKGFNKGTAYNYLQCQLYCVEKFLSSLGGLKKEVLPLLATVLGNDYVSANTFAAFYNQIKLPRRNHTKSAQQRRIQAVTEWLRYETYESALRKILGRVKKPLRARVYNEIKKVQDIYANEGSRYLGLLDIDHTMHSKRIDADAVDLNLDELDDDDDEQDVDCVDEMTTGDDEDNEYDLPEWFVMKFRKCLFPAAFMDVAVRNMYIFVPLLEDYTRETSHMVTLNLMRAIHKILSYGRVRKFVYMGRNGNGLKTCYDAQWESDLPSLDAIPSLSAHDSRSTFLSILQQTRCRLDGVPDEWQLLNITIIYWIESCRSFINQSHIYALCLGMLIVYFTKDKIGFVRNKRKFKIKFDKDCKESDTTPASAPSATQFDDAISQIATDDCVSVMKNVIDYFQMDEKLQRNHRHYDITIVDIFARYQCCLYYIKHLNVLLNRPYESIAISDYYNGTFLYNLCANFAKRTDLDQYVGIFLKDSPTILNLFRCFVASITSNLTTEMQTMTVKRRKKRKNKKKVNVNDQIDESVHVESEDGIDDVNNRFSVLGLR